MSMTHADNMSDAIKDGLDHLPEKRYLQLTEHVDEFHDDHELLEKIVEMINESGQAGCFDEIYALLNEAGKQMITLREHQVTAIAEGDKLLSVVEDNQYKYPNIMMSKYKMCNVQGTNCIIDTTTNKIVDTVENLVRDSITLSEINDLIDSLPVHDDISLVVDIIEENKNK